MRKIYVCFSTPKKWLPFAELIKWADKTNYSHVYFEIPTNSLRDPLIYQASHTMVNFMGYKHFYDANTMVKKYELWLEDENYCKLMQFCVDESGKPYSVKQILGISVVKILQMMKISYSKNIFRDEGEKYVCSELADIILKDFFGINSGKNRDLINPFDIDNVLSTNPDKCTLLFVA